MTDVISIEGVVVWAGSRTRSQRRVNEVARWREKYPTIGDVVAKLGFTPDPIRDKHWSTLLLTRIDGTRPVSRIHYTVSPLGRIETVTEE